ncbi:MerR family transcriptional regulator [Paracoccus aestuarii]|uniref:MerR family transcriptional regulator n=1 Tax=Paracoccus aestuarii TaxID=453842 RepID=A0A418ZSA1_9RHOB|nr:MerR family transcriptional regulator [Paracoccus aestuarii]RJL00309.1 MerR family transcriptional regulator [Paracoccus aestuarii]WCQ99672.1 MerR family transcriptional regulator [Paracoccus aestuarii]
MAKGAEAFRSIGETARMIGVAPHVLRYWETQFLALSPMKRPDGRRYYRPDDVTLAAGICALLRDDGMTIRGARKMIAADRGAAVRDRGARLLSGDRPDHAPPPEAPPFPGPAPESLPQPAAAEISARDWLGRLTGFARLLRGTQGGPAARPALLRLAHAMLDLP